MSGKTTRISSGAAPKATRTDWARVQKLGDKAVDAAIAADPDAYPLEEERLGRSGGAYRYQLVTGEDGRYRWRLIAGNGDVLATSHESFATSAAAKYAIAGVRNALLGGDLLAA